MGKLINCFAVLCVIFAGLLSLHSCSLLNNDENDPEAVTNLIGTWKGESYGKWRVIFREDMTARVTNYEYDSMGKSVFIIMDYETTWSVYGDEFDLGYYGGYIVNDDEISFNTRLARYEDMRMHKVSEDNLDDLIAQQEEKEKKEAAMSSLVGRWEGLSNDGKYVRCLDLKKGDGFFWGMEYLYNADGCVVSPEGTFNWEINMDEERIILSYESADKEEQGTYNMDDSTMVFSTAPLKMRNPIINRPATVKAAAGTWIDEEGRTMTLNPDMTVDKEDFYSDEDRWQTADNEVQYMMYGSDEFNLMVRYVLAGDELILFPGFAESPRFHRVKK